MDIIEVESITIQENGCLLVKPVGNPSKMFRFIYRAAMEVDWEEESQSFICPKPRKWSYFDWYRQVITAVVSEMGTLLKITENTLWQNVSTELKNQIKNYTYEKIT
jgi:hypothetical protein